MRTRTANDFLEKELAQGGNGKPYRVRDFLKDRGQSKTTPLQTLNKWLREAGLEEIREKGTYYTNQSGRRIELVINDRTEKNETYMHRTDLNKRILELKRQGYTNE